MKETILQAISKLESQFNSTQMSDESALKINETIIGLRGLIESSDITLSDDNMLYKTDLTKPAYPITGDYKVEILVGDGGGNIESIDGKWYIMNTDFEVSNEELECLFLQTRVSKDLVYFHSDEPTDDYRFYGYKFVTLIRHHPEDTYRWYDRLRKEWVNEPFYSYRNKYIKSK